MFLLLLDCKLHTCTVHIFRMCVVVRAHVVFLCWFWLMYRYETGTVDGTGTGRRCRWRQPVSSTGPPAGSRDPGIAGSRDPSSRDRIFYRYDTFRNIGIQIFDIIRRILEWSITLTAETEMRIISGKLPATRRPPPKMLSGRCGYNSRTKNLQIN